MVDKTKDAANSELQKITAQLGELSGTVKQTAEDALNEAKNAGTLSAETKQAVDKALTELNTLSTKQNELQVQLGEAEQRFARAPAGASSAAAERAGDLVIKADNLIELSNNVRGGQKVNIAVPRAALITFGNLPSSPDTKIIGDPNPRLTVRDLLMPGRTNSNAIAYIKETGFTNNADTVAENTEKPYSELDFEEVLEGVKTIAHLLKASKQILDDLPQLASFINGRMLTGLKHKEDGQLMFGNGVGKNLKGIYTQATAYVQPAGVDIVDPTSVDIMRMAMLQAALAELPATGHVLHEVDWTGMELSKDETGRYIFANPLGYTVPTLWGLPVASLSDARMLGNFLTGSFAEAAQIFDREDANVLISTENDKDFDMNMISIRCEERLALAVYRPESFIKGSFA